MSGLCTVHLLIKMQVLIYVGKEGAFEPFTRAIAMCKFVEGHSQKYYRSNRKLFSIRYPI